MELTTEEQQTIDELSKEYDGEIATYKVPRFGLVVIAAPTNPAEYSRLVDSLKSDKSSAGSALQTFALACVVHPEREKVKQLLKRKPAFGMTLAARGQELAGGDIEELGND